MLRKRLGQARAFDLKLDGWNTKPSPNLTKIEEDDLYELVNTPPKGINEKLHGLGKIEDQRSKNEVFESFQKLGS